MIKKPLLLSVIISLSAILPISMGITDTNRRFPSEDGAFTAGPYYSSTTKSYFELIRNNGQTWDEAQALASTHKFKNTSGRLAVIDRPEVHRFLVGKFAFMQDTWIGLRFFCEDSILVWSNGTSGRGSYFSNWSHNTQKTNLSCPQTGYLYTYINGNAFDWDLASWQKTSNYVLIEYPTGKK
ncbi:MAG: hypothetical protein H6912_10920 [Kordiimonadaceae bacterium]|nr:hypothetical protein [Kordiimonadaceae bacterium]